MNTKDRFTKAKTEHWRTLIYLLILEDTFISNINLIQNFNNQEYSLQITIFDKFMSHGQSKNEIDNLDISYFLFLLIHNLLHRR